MNTNCTSYVLAYAATLVRYGTFGFLYFFVIFTHPSLAEVEGNPPASEGPKKNETIQALGEWVPVPAGKKSLKASDSKEVEVQDQEEVSWKEEQRIVEDLLLARRLAEKPLPKADVYIRTTVVRREDKLRFPRIRRLHHQRIEQQQRVLRRMQQRESRGIPEIRICTLNLQGYSSPQEAQRILRTVPPADLRNRERGIVQAISETGCSVVAVQGLVGRGFARAKAGIDRLAQRLSRSNGGNWRGFVGDSNHRLAFNGFLVQEDGIEVATIKSHNFHPLLPLEGSKREGFYRGPVELQLLVPQRPYGPKRRILLMTMHLNAALTGASSAGEIERVQLAQSLRNLFEERLKKLDPLQNPIGILLGDRGGFRGAPATKILEGYYDLDVLNRRGPCKIVEKVEEDSEGQVVRRRSRAPVVYDLSCEGRRGRRPKSLFGVGTEGLPPAYPIVLKEIDDVPTLVNLIPSEEEVQEQASREGSRYSEIYLRQGDLPLAWVKENVPFVYASGVTKVRGVPPSSPLIWVDLNW